MVPENEVLTDGGDNPTLIEGPVVDGPGIDGPGIDRPAPSPPTVNPSLSAAGLTATYVTVTQATGIRRVRGQATTVNLPHYEIRVGKQLAAITSTTKDKPVCAVAEILDTEESAILSAVAEKRGDTQPIEINRPPVVTTT